MNVVPKLLLLAGFVALTAPAAVGQPPAAKPAEEAKKVEAKAVVVPFELLKSRHMAVQVKINGKGPYRLIFDTGAPTNLINNRIAKDSGVMKKDEKPGFMFGMAGAKTLDTLEVGGVKMNKASAMVMDHPTVEAISKALGPIDGIIGFPFFARYSTTIDYEKKEMTFVPNGYDPPDALQGLMQKMMNLSAERGKKQEPAVVGAAALWGFAVDKAAGDEDAGVTVKEVLAGGAAAEAGLKPGDRLLTLDGRWTDTVGDALTAASLVRPGRAVVVVVKRAGKEVALTVKPVKGV